MTTHNDPFDDALLSFSTMLTVRNVKASAGFYVGRFGFRITEEMDGLCRLQREGVSLYLTEESPPTSDKPGITLMPPPDAGRPSVILIFHVSDVRAVHARLLRLGVTFQAPPQTPPWGGWRCFAQDPDGYLIEIEQPE